MSIWGGGKKRLEVLRLVQMMSLGNLTTLQLCNVTRVGSFQHGSGNTRNWAGI